MDRIYRGNARVLSIWECAETFRETRLRFTAEDGEDDERRATTVTAVAAGRQYSRKT